MAVLGAVDHRPGKAQLERRRHQTVVEEDVFLGMGYEVWDGPEVVTVWENFDALNTDQGHPSRSKLDTFYLDGATISNAIQAVSA